jgi:hypothetical protein
MSSKLAISLWGSSRCQPSGTQASEQRSESEKDSYKGVIGAGDLDQEPGWAGEDTLLITSTRFRIFRIEHREKHRSRRMTQLAAS